MKAKNYMTPFGFKKLRDELNHLLKVERPETTKVVQWAASLGDRSENADYKYGKKKLREIDSRIRFLTKKINSAVVIDPISIDTEKIQFGATVIVEDQEGEEKEFSIVGADEINPTKGLISWNSPIGKSLIGKEEGDEVQVRTPSGIKDFEIINIEYKEIDFGG